MFSKSLFKQSCKANGVLWAVITAAVCIMLSCVMLISGNANISTSKNAIQDTIIEGELNSQIKKRGINYYNIANDSLMYFDETLNATKEETLAKPETQQEIAALVPGLMAGGMTQEQAIQVAAAQVLLKKQPEMIETVQTKFSVYVNDVATKIGGKPGTDEYLEIAGLMLYTLNPKDAEGNFNPQIEKFYKDLKEEVPEYNVLGVFTMSEEERALYRSDYADKNSTIFLAGNLILEENVQRVLNELSKFGVTLEKYQEFGFDNYDKLKSLSKAALINYRANFADRVTNLDPSLTPEQRKEAIEKLKVELNGEITQSLLASLPHQVADALEELGQMDLYGNLVGTIFFKMAGLLLPIIYLIMTSNNLIAGQVDSGSMAYVLSSSVKRRTVTFTQAVYLVGSLFAMFACTSITSVICYSFVEVESALTIGKLLLINLGAFITMFAMSGICFLASCWFNRSKHSMAIGGGLNMFFLVATMLGLFGSEIMPSIMRMDALNFFNYLTVITLFDVTSILEGTLTFLWKFAILIGIALVCYTVGSEKFVKKDLPL